MDTHDMLVELLAIKLFEHAPMGDGSPNRLSWSEADPEDRQNTRNIVLNATKPEELYEDD
jgi:hypothetical protein